MSHASLVYTITRLYRRLSPEFRRRLVGILGFLAILNIFVWCSAWWRSMHTPSLLGLVVLAYGLGLRHAVDADHIAAIDNTTRKLMSDGGKPVAVGFFFSLGHSTVVILLSVLLAISASFVTTSLPAFRQTGTMIGTGVSSFFLLMIGAINLVTFVGIFRLWGKVIRGDIHNKQEIHDHMHITGAWSRLFRPFFRTITRSWHMYPVGFLFGLGFDTASEVGLLSISAATGGSGLPVWEILLLPLAFTAGMSLIDTLDGVLMLGAYGWAYVNPVRKLYYNMNITLISVIIALGIGGIEALQILSEHFSFRGWIFDAVAHMDIGGFGYVIIGAFLFSWIVSIIIYRIRGYDRMDLSG